MHGAKSALVRSALLWRLVLPLTMNESADNFCRGRLRFFGASSKGDEALRGFTGGLTFAADAIAVLDAIGVAQATFICQSMGGTLGLHAAVHFPDRVAALVLCNTHMGAALPLRLQALRKTHLLKVDELFGPAELFPRANAPAAIGASLGGKALGREFQRRNPELAYWYGINGALNQVDIFVATSTVHANAAVNTSHGRARAGR